MNADPDMDPDTDPGFALTQKGTWICIANADTGPGVRIQQSVINAHLSGSGTLYLYPGNHNVKGRIWLCIQHVKQWIRQKVMRNRSTDPIRMNCVSFQMFFWYNFSRARVCLPLLCWSRPIMIFRIIWIRTQRASRDKLASYRFSRPSIYLATHPST